MHVTRIKSDRLNQYKKEMEYYGNMMTEGAYIPVDLYGKRVGGTMEEQAQENREYYDLDTQGLGGEK